MNIKLFTKEDNLTETTIEIKRYVDFNLNEKSIKQYLLTLFKQNVSKLYVRFAFSLTL